MRIAGDGRVEDVGLACFPVLDGQGWPRGAVAEADPADRAGVGAVLAAVAPPCPA